MFKKNKIAMILTLSLSVGATAMVAPAFASNGLESNVFAAELQQDEIQKIASEAYIYTYPLVLMDITREQLTNKGIGGSGFFHFRQYPPADFKDVVRPNFDTLYSIAWIDVSEEPMIVSAPDTHGRYYLLPMYDMWTDIYAAPGSRTSGTQAGDFAMVPEGWEGELPEGVKRIEAPTEMNWIIGRTQSNGPTDYSVVNEIQDGYKVTPLSKWGTDYQPSKLKVDPSVDLITPPLTQVANMDAKTYFARASKLMQKYGTHQSDGSQLLRLERIGLTLDGDWELDKLSDKESKVLDQGVAEARQTMKEFVAQLATMKNGWIINTDTMGVYGNSYLKRAVIAEIGLGANLTEDAIYPLAMHDADGDKFTGEQNYELHFEKDEIPPVDAFWSVTMYDFEGFAVENELKRYAIGDRDALKYNKDGSLTLYIQHQNPGKDKASNWLPSAKTGDLGITMRLYAPKQSALIGEWIPPAIQKAK